MTSMQEGERVPKIILRDLEDKSHNPLEAAKQTGFAVIAFLKSSCPVCQMTAPYLERLKQLNPTLPLFAISQDDKEETRAFQEENLLTFPLLLDTDLEITRNFELTNVPSLFVINGEDGRVEKNMIGFEREVLEYINNRCASPTGPEKKVSLFTESDQVPAYRPG